MRRVYYMKLVHRNSSNNEIIKAMNYNTRSMRKAFNARGKWLGVAAIGCAVFGIFESLWARDVNNDLIDIYERLNKVEIENMAMDLELMDLNNRITKIEKRIDILESKEDKEACVSEESSEE